MTDPQSHQGDRPDPPTANAPDPLMDELRAALLHMGDLEAFRPAIAGQEDTDPHWQERARRNGIMYIPDEARGPQ